MNIGAYKVITIPTGAWRQNCYLIKHMQNEELVLIDPGSDADDILEKINKEGAKLKLVLLTHAHHDHVGAVKSICEKFNIHFYVHKDDVKLLKRAPNYAFIFERKHLEISKNYQLLEENSMEWGEDVINIDHFPGHTPGGVCYSFGNMAFTGDTLLNEYIGRTDLPGSDPFILKISVDRMLNSLSGDTLLFPGHGRPWTVNDAKSWWRSQKLSPTEYRLKGDFDDS
jgi:glyoxylase-like metal-dependent hydrolase (beta-lactamase superfamily II)